MKLAEVAGFDAASGAHDLRFLNDSALNGRIHLALACCWCPASRAALREHAPPGGARYPASNQAGLLASTCSYGSLMASCVIWAAPDTAEPGFI